MRKCTVKYYFLYRSGCRADATAESLVVVVDGAFLRHTYTYFTFYRVVVVSGLKGFNSNPHLTCVTLRIFWDLPLRAAISPTGTYYTHTTRKHSRRKDYLVQLANSSKSVELTLIANCIGHYL